MIVLEKNIPPPETIGMNTTGRPQKYPFAVMEVGDSFWLEGVEGDRAAAAARKWRQRNPAVYFRTKIERGGTRLWRVA